MSGPNSSHSPDGEEGLVLHLDTLSDTERLAHVLAKMLGSGQLLTLTGDLGSGKTTLARALIRALAHDPDLEVPSPSFALVQPYELASQTVLHADLYRLEASLDIEELGLLDDPEALVIVEWAEKAPQLGAFTDLAVTLEADPESDRRTARIAAPGGRFDLAKLASALKNLTAPHGRGA